MTVLNGTEPIRRIGRRRRGKKPPQRAVELGWTAACIGSTVHSPVLFVEDAGEADPRQIGCHKPDCVIETRANANVVSRMVVQRTMASEQKAESQPGRRPNQLPFEHSAAVGPNCLFMDGGSSSDNPMTALKR